MAVLVPPVGAVAGMLSYKIVHMLSTVGYQVKLDGLFNLQDFCVEDQG